MKITNKFNLPESIVNAVKKDPYSRGSCDISVTGLLDPPRKSALTEKHFDELEEDASDRIWSLIGQIGHGILERASKEAVVERRLFSEFNGWKVGGAMDHWLPKEGILRDYKFVTAWKVAKGVPEEWAQQQNIYAELLRRNGEVVRRIEIIAILRDWSKLEAERDAGGTSYPKSQVVVVPIPLVDSAEVVSFIHERVSLHAEARKGNLPECSAEERWAKPTKWAAIRVGADRASKLFDVQQEAQTYAKQFNKDGSLVMNVEERLGVNTRCESYCAARRFCSQADALGVKK